MNHFLILAFALASGVLLAAIFFGGLWWTVYEGVSSSHPALWFLGSRLLRMSVVLLGFYYVGGSDWRRWGVCLAGFVSGRFFVISRTRRPMADELDAKKEARRAS